ncbi:MAG: sulfotransferase domain-containing protein [Candidatus Palauibacterales bacterium]|nr:sulfotransferase domain-containing protein [Candidatus Palauibacterales bacterium]
MSGPKLNFVASYPKSGNTWVRMLIGTYLYNAEGKFTRTKTSDTNTTPFHNVSPVPLDRLGFEQQMQLRPAAMLQLARPPRATLVKSHDAAVIFKGMAQFAPQFTDRVICVVRDPKDVAPSLADHIGVSIEEAVEKMDEQGFRLKGDNNLAHFTSSWSINVKSWLEYDQAPTHFVRYRDLHADTEGELTAILEFLGFEDIDPEAVRRSVEENRFENVRKEEEESGFSEQSDSQDRFFRKGKTGSWREDVPEHLARRIEIDHGAMMRELGYDLALVDEPAPFAADDAPPPDADVGSGADDSVDEPAETAGPAGRESGVNEVGVAVG